MLISLLNSQNHSQYYKFTLDMIHNNILTCLRKFVILGIQVNTLGSVNIYKLSGEALRYGYNYI